MREIKFRAWDESRKGWEQPMSPPVELVEALVEATLGADFFSGQKSEVEKFYGKLIWMQYTGLKDKTGKEIYEGDIVRRFVQDERHEDRQAEQVFEIRWNEEYAEFEPRSANGWTPVLHYIHDSGIEVIGNIYEDADLLKV